MKEKQYFSSGFSKNKRNEILLQVNQINNSLLQCFLTVIKGKIN